MAGRPLTCAFIKVSFRFLARLLPNTTSFLKTYFVEAVPNWDDSDFASVLKVESEGLKASVAKSLLAFFFLLLEIEKSRLSLSLRKACVMASSSRSAG